MENYQKIRQIINENKIITFFLCFFIYIVVFFSTLISAPKDFIYNSYFKIEKGESLSEIAKTLKENNFIKSEEVFKFFTVILGGEKRIIAGDYLVKDKENVFSLSKRIINGKFQTLSIKITLPEGISNKEISDILKREIVGFNVSDFLIKTKQKEGYLFPDTYFFSPKVTSDEVIEKLSNNFSYKITKFKNDIEKSNKNLDDVIKMASILEGEAKTTEDRRIVSGILWKRIEMKIPLQVDATFKYINGKGTFDLTLEDLKIDSPYNTYRILGLPKTPINNPGEDAIYASLNPIKTNYLYFLTGKDGKMYYSKTFEEHKIKKQKYLR